MGTDVQHSLSGSILDPLRAPPQVPDALPLTGPSFARSHHWSPQCVALPRSGHRSCRVLTRELACSWWRLLMLGTCFLQSLTRFHLPENPVIQSSSTPSRRLWVSWEWLTEGLGSPILYLCSSLLKVLPHCSSVGCQVTVCSSGSPLLLWHIAFVSSI